MVPGLGPKRRLRPCCERSRSGRSYPYAIVFYEGRLAHELRSLGADVHVANEQEKSFSRVIYRCSEFVKSRKIQILHSHNYKENLVALLLSRICKVPHLVRTEHGHPEPYSVARSPRHWCVLAEIGWRPNTRRPGWSASVQIWASIGNGKWSRKSERSTQRSGSGTRELQF